MSFGGQKAASSARPPCAGWRTQPARSARLGQDASRRRRRLRMSCHPSMPADYRGCRSYRSVAARSAGHPSASSGRCSARRVTNDAQHETQPPAGQGSVPSSAVHWCWRGGRGGCGRRSIASLSHERCPALSIGRAAGRCAFGRRMCGWGRCQQELMRRGRGSVACGPGGTSAARGGLAGWPF